jgi:hypothetical protein
VNASAAYLLPVSKADHCTLWAVCCTPTQLSLWGAPISIGSTVNCLNCYCGWQLLAIKVAVARCRQTVRERRGSWGTELKGSFTAAGAAGLCI